MNSETMTGHKNIEDLTPHQLQTIIAGMQTELERTMPEVQRRMLKHQILQHRVQLSQIVLKEFEDKYLNRPIPFDAVVEAEGNGQLGLFIHNHTVIGMSLSRHNFRKGDIVEISLKERPGEIIPPEHIRH